MIEGFFSLILEVWNQDFLGISIGNVVISIGIIVFSIILRAIVISRVFKFLENLAKETETEADDILLETLEKIEQNNPYKIQTGPAIRKDLITIKKHLNFIKSKNSKKIYSILTEGIIANNGK